MAQNSPKLFKKARAKEEQLLLASLNKVEHPRRNALAIAAIWIILAIVLGVVLTSVNRLGYAQNFMTSFLIMLGISFLWVLMRLGLGEKGRLKYHNARNMRLMREAPLNQRLASKIDLPKLRALRKQQSWLGIMTLASVSGVVVLITALVHYL